MYQCLSCGGNLKFDISSQMLSCIYCNALFNPYDVVKETDAALNDSFEAKIFTCSQCGGEVYTVDNESASFCSYCGASAILSERISNEKRPNHIITFKVTKEDCKKEYKKAMSKAFFAPNKLKNSDFIDGFRGIYMPYWNYCIKQEGEIDIPAWRSYYSSDDKHTEHYYITGNISAKLSGNVHDASANFYDEISEALEPYDISDSVDFTPSFLSGFYAEAPNVTEHMYKNDAIEMLEKNSIENIKKHFSNAYSIDENRRNGFRQWPSGEIDSVKTTMMPVWFLSYRNKDRVAYATVNGQTGKVVADIPVSIWKYILVSLLMSLPMFLFLNITWFFTPPVLLLICMVLLAITGIICKNEIKEIYEKENNIGDVGLEWKKYGMRVTPPKTQKKSYKKNWMKIFMHSLIPWIFLQLVFLVNNQVFLITPVIIAVITVGVVVVSLEQQRKIKARGFTIALIFSILVVLYATFMFLIEPTEDIWYYSAILGILFAILINFIFIIKNFNRIAMRRLPQFDKKGGDDGAY